MKDVIFVLPPNLVLLDLAGPVDVFRNANNRVPETYRLRFVSPSPTVSVAGGLQFSSIEPLPTCLHPGSILVLMGATRGITVGREPNVQRIVNWLRGNARATQLLCVCAGSLLAARAGLLSGRECTTHHDYIGALRAIEPRARVLENRIFVEDRSVWTSAGVTAGLDLALFVVARELGSRVAADIARDLVVYLRRAGTDPALSPWVLHRNHIHPAVHRVQDAITHDPAADWSNASMASIACNSARNLSRLFSRYAGCSPLDYVQLIRFAHARLLITRSRLSLDQVAARTGFRSAQHLRRVWHRWERLPPSAFRAAESEAVSVPATPRPKLRIVGRSQQSEWC